MSKIYGFSLACTFLTWILLMVGGLVNPNGASMACPDWYFFPTCHGQLWPPMVGGVLYEHGHRLVASLVGFCVLILALWCFFSHKVDGLTKRLAYIALFLVVLQGTFGGITVLLNLSALVSTLHLVCAMIFFGLLICISFRLSPAKKPIYLFDKSQSWLFIAITLTFLQLLLGGVVRHMGAGLACGDDLFGCGPSFWPSWFYGQLHMSHRILGYALFLVVIFSSLKAKRQALLRDNKNLAFLSILPIVVTLTQVALGLLAIYSIRNPVVLALHTGFGGLLLASLLTIYLLGLETREAWVQA